LTGGWNLDLADRRMVVPPSPNAKEIARTLEVKVADTTAGCAASKQTVTLIALGPTPELDTAGIALWPDDGRIELRGQRLKGVQVAWSVPGDDKKQGSDACLDPSVAKVQTCSIPLPAGLPTDVQLSWLPAYGRFGPDVETYDAFGNRVERDTMRLRPARVVLSKPLVQTTGIDVTSGSAARVVLTHPEAVASVGCGS